MSKMMTIYLTMKSRRKPFKFKDEIHQPMEELLENKKVFTSLIVYNNLGDDVEVKISCDITKIEGDNIYAILDDVEEEKISNARQSGSAKVLNFEDYRKKRKTL